MAIELPKDAEGREIPLDTVALFGGNGNAYSIKRWVYTTHFDLGDSTAGQWRALTDKMTRLDPELMYLEPPDSWEKLEEDLRRASERDVTTSCCRYFNATKKCATCSIYDNGICCTHKDERAYGNILDRIRKLRDEDE